MENVEQTQPATEVSQDLQDKLSAIKALVTVHSLLGAGMFQVRNAKTVEDSIQFITALHQQVMEEALNHPDADKVQELIDYKAAKGA